jgi:hypothetical protein
MTLLPVDRLMAQLQQDARVLGFGRYMSYIGRPGLYVDCWQGRSALGGDLFTWEINGERGTEQQARAAIASARRGSNG